MTKEQAIEIALTRLRSQGSVIGSEAPSAVRKDGNMRLGRHRTGWVVYVSIVVPEGFEPDHIFVEVYDPDGEVYIPMML